MTFFEEKSSPCEECGSTGAEEPPHKSRHTSHLCLEPGHENLTVMSSSAEACNLSLRMIPVMGENVFPSDLNWKALYVSVKTISFWD